MHIKQALEFMLGCASFKVIGCSSLVSLQLLHVTLSIALSVSSVYTYYLWEAGLHILTTIHNVMLPSMINLHRDNNNYYYYVAVVIAGIIKCY